MGMDPQPVTVYEVVRRAVEICDPGDDDEVLGRLLEHFEDHDEPVRAVLDELDSWLADAIEDVDVELDDPSVAMAGAVIQYLARRRDELEAPADEVLRLAARAEYRGDPPESVVAWLSDRGVRV
jgi:hypothetical protein